MRIDQAIGGIFRVDGDPVKGARVKYYPKSAPTMVSMWDMGGAELCKKMPITSIINGSTNLPFVDFAEFDAFGVANFFLTSSGGDGGLDTTAGDARYVQLAPPAGTQFVSMTNLNSYGQPTKQLHIGSNETIVDSGLNFQKGALINVTTPSGSGGGKPIFTTFSMPDTLSANGILWLNYPQVAGKANWMMMVRSNSGEAGAGSVDICYTERLLVSERAGVAVTGKVTNIQGFTDASKDHMFPSGADKVTFTNPATKLHEIQNNDSFRWAIYALGDVQQDGADICVPLVTAADFTPTYAHKRYIYNGPGGTCTLPDPATVKVGWTIEVINIGSGSLALTRNVTLDNATPMGAIVQGHPNNAYRFTNTGTAYVKVP